MQERDLRHLIEDVRNGKLPRRSFIQQMVSLGLTAPMAASMLMHSGVAQAQAAFTYKPTKRGGGGALKAAPAPGRSIQPLPRCWRTSAANCVRHPRTLRSTTCGPATRRT